MQIRPRLDEGHQESVNILKTMPPDEALKKLQALEIIDKDLYDRKFSNLRKQNTQQKKQLEIRNEELKDINKKIDTILEVDNADFKMVQFQNKEVDKKEVCAIIGYSDWHIEEVVDPDVVNGLNEYNIDIAQQRVVRLFENTASLIKKEQKSNKVNKMMIWLGGDFMSGYIHDELEEENQMSPTEAVIWLRDILLNGIRYLMDTTGIEDVIVQTNAGNHGRTTQKKRIGTDYKNSYEFLLYQILKKELDEETQFILNKSQYGYVDIYGYKIRTMHGDMVRYQGGIGGISIPLIKHIHRLNQQVRADINILGHFHQLISPTNDINVNGSLIGPSAYSIARGYSPEKPQQMFKTLSPEHGIVGSYPIFCE